MIEIRLGDRYAKSILGLAREKGQLEAVRNDFALIASICRQNPDFVKMLKSPLIHADKKQKIIDAILGGKLSKITDLLVSIIIRKHREAWLNDIAERYLFWYDMENNVTRGVISSATKLSEEQLSKIRSIVERDLKTDFVLEEKIDPDLIGGIVLKVGDLLYDGSLSGKLRELKNEFKKNPYIKHT